MSQGRRIKQFTSNVRNFKKNNLDKKIKGYKDSNDSKPYLLSIKKIEGLDVEKLTANNHQITSLNYAAKVQIEYHVTFFYRNIDSKIRDDKQLFFFGRTAKSRPIDLVKKQGSTFYESTEDEHMFFHTMLNKEAFGKNVFIVLEAVVSIVSHTKKSYSVDKFITSGGWMTERLTNLTVDDYGKPKIIDLVSGSPRELGAHIDTEEDLKPTKGAKINAKISMTV